MKTKDFELLIRNEIESINKKLATFPHRQEIIDKISNANAFGITEKFKIFFDEIKLPIEEDELQAISERHKFVHGRMKLCDADWQKVILHGQVLETLLNKVLLKLLGYKGSYIDRSVVGWPDKNLT
jgi:hypothetical protein